MRAYGEWSLEADCRSEPAVTAFRTGSYTARNYCFGCPVMGECLEYALLYDEHGIWGGKTETERKAVRASSPLLVLLLRQEALDQQILEDRYVIAQYFETLQKVRQLNNQSHHFGPAGGGGFVAPSLIEEEPLEPPEEFDNPQESGPDAIAL